MTTARKNVFDPKVEGIYHCYSRCVRRAFLCGFDSLTGNNYNHRKQWIKERLQLLSEVFIIDLLGFAIMSNHIHPILRNRPSIAESLSVEDIARRWLTLFPKRRIKGVAQEPSDAEIKALASNKARIEELRWRLCSISWFMRCLNENIARRANKEDGVTGRFWEGRFKCTELADEASILTCMVYVDLNEIRAKISTSPEESRFTSAYARIKAKQAREIISKANLDGVKIEQSRLNSLISTSESDMWLAPISVKDDERGIFSDLSLGEYLEVLDVTGRELKHGKAGAIPEQIAPILKRLSIKPEQWPLASSSFRRKFPRFSAAPELMLKAAERIGQRWFQGIGAARLIFRAG